MSKKIQSIKQATKQFDAKVSNTILESAQDVCRSILHTFREYDACDMAVALDEAKIATEDLPETSRAPRTTEWKDFIFSTVNHNFAGALQDYKAQIKTRVLLFSFAKQLHIAKGNRKKAWKAATTKGGSGTPKTAAQKFGMALGVIKNVQTKSTKYKAFRVELAALCKKHGIKY